MILKFLDSKYYKLKQELINILKKLDKLGDK